MAAARAPGPQHQAEGPEARAAGRAPLLTGFSYDFSPEDRVGIIGPNGSGKSSLLQLIAAAATPGTTPPETAGPCHSGRLEVGSTVRLAYFDQHSHVLEAGRDAAGRERRVLDVVQEVAESVEVGGTTLRATQLLERFLFPPAQQHQPLSRLSGGERRRLHLCRLLIGAPNLLLLDEPTNDLDVQTLAVLEDFLEDFRGCVVVVSHDRCFLDRTVDRLFAFRAGRLERFEGNYSAYLERQRAAGAAVASMPDAMPPPTPARRHSPPQAAGGSRRRSFGQQRELTRLEEDLTRWEERRRELESRLAAGGADYTTLEALTRELAALSERITAGEDRWLELSDLDD